MKFTLTDLGTFGGTWSAANAINSNGQVVGTFGSASDQFCFSWQQGSKTLTFADETSPRFCDARAVDFDGTIAGGMKTPNTFSRVGAFRRDPNGQITIVSHQRNADSWGLGVAKGTVVGLSANQAVKWDSAGIATTLVNAPYGYAQANGINSMGQIVGFTQQGSGSFLSWVWQNGSLTNLPEFVPTWGTNAWAINDHGVVVGGGTQTYAGGICVAIWYGGAPTNLGCGPWGLAISSDNWVVGGGRIWNWCTSGCARLSVPDFSCSLTDLNTLLDSSGAGWVVMTATGINDKHQIVGWGKSPRDGQNHAILLTPNNLPLCYPT